MPASLTAVIWIHTAGRRTGRQPSDTAAVAELTAPVGGQGQDLDGPSDAEEVGHAPVPAVRGRLLHRRLGGALFVAEPAGRLPGPVPPAFVRQQRRGRDRAGAAGAAAGRPVGAAAALEAGAGPASAGAGPGPPGAGPAP